MVTTVDGKQTTKKSLSEIEKDVLHELIGAHENYSDQVDEIAKLCIDIRDLVLKEDVDDEELLGLLEKRVG